MIDPNSRRARLSAAKSFENEDLEVRISLDDGKTHSCISLVGKGYSEDQKEYCVLMNSESYHKNEWQNFMDQPDENRK